MLDATLTYARCHIYGCWMPHLRVLDAASTGVGCNSKQTAWQVLIVVACISADTSAYMQAVIAVISASRSHRFCIPFPSFPHLACPLFVSLASILFHFSLIVWIRVVSLWRISWQIAPQAHEADASVSRHTPSLLWGIFPRSKETGWVAGRDIMKRRLLDALFETYRISQIQNCCLELSNGRCPGCDYIIPSVALCRPALCLSGTARSCIYVPRMDLFSYRRGLLTLSVQQQ